MHQLRWELASFDQRPGGSSGPHASWLNVFAASAAAFAYLSQISLRRSSTICWSGTFEMLPAACLDYSHEWSYPRLVPIIAIVDQVDANTRHHPKTLELHLAGRTAL